MPRLIELYLFLLAGVLLGVILTRCTPRQTPQYLGNFIFWIGAPFTIVVFLHGSNLTAAVWISPVISWVAMFLGLGLGWLWLRFGCPQRNQAGRGHRVGKQGGLWSGPTQGSFLLATMAGNTGYLGYPIALTLAGNEQFSWALLYDLLGTAIGTYGLGVGVAAVYGGRVSSLKMLVGQMLLNPPLWSFILGFLGRSLPLPKPVVAGLQSLAWLVVFASLVLIGMRLGQLKQWQGVGKLLPCLVIKMLVVPLLLGMGLTGLGVQGLPRFVLVLQAAMPPAFSTVVLAEIYHLDRELSVTAVVAGTLGLLALLPVWVKIFGV
jgi:malate permease and related proteins